MQNLNKTTWIHTWPRRNRWLGIACLFASLAIAVSLGCYPDWPEHSGTAEVHGELELDGLPLNDARVILVPRRLHNDAGRPMRLAYGHTGADGKFKLACADGTKLLVAGPYSLIISQTVPRERVEDYAPWDAESLPAGWSRLAIFSDPFETLPATYHRETELMYKLKASPSIVRPKFELHSVDQRLRLP